MASTDDYADFFTPPPQPLGYRQGVIVSWNTATGANVVRIANTNFTNLPLIKNIDLVNFRVNDYVAVIKYNDSYAILGKIKNNPVAPTLWLSVPLYAQFQQLTAAGGTGYATVNVGTLASWEGRVYITHHSRIGVDGVWGQASGSNTVTYQLQVDGVTVGTWTTSGGLDVGNKGPFDVTSYRDREWIKVEVKITSSVGSGTVAIQVLACYLMQ